VAKNDGYTSRASALAEDEPLDQFYRPAAASSKLRAGSSSSADRPLPADEMEPGEEESFLRSRRRVQVRKGFLPKNRIARIAVFFGMALGLALFVMLGIAVHDFLKHDPRFRIESASAIQILGNSEITRPELLAVFGSDIGRNVFFVPLDERRAELEQLPWVEHATLMRLLPNQLRISIVERTPVAFVRRDKEIGLVDANGVLLNMTPALMAAHHYSFPVVAGIEPKEPLSTRAARMKIYQRFVAELDSGGEKVSDQLSEVDLSDPEDVKVLMPEEGSDILAHFGDDKFLSRYKNYKAHLAGWRQQYPHLAAVDLRYENQVVLEMEKGTQMASSVAPAAKSTDSAEAADAAPKPAAKAVAHPAAAKAHAKAPTRAVSQ
jgi:cell division protein FtsQ